VNFGSYESTQILVLSVDTNLLRTIKDLLEHENPKKFRKNLINLSNFGVRKLRWDEPLDGWCKC
jgi:hypothetical protein